jgi:P27 family predicted phage terminase small subunit
MGKGRKSLPNEIKEAAGTLRPCRVKTDAIKPTIELNTEPPNELNEWGAQMYRSIMDEYSKIGLISKVDVGSLLILCNEFGTYCEADDIIKAKGLEIEEDVYSVKGELTGTKTVANPMLKVRNDAMKNYKTLCVEFGLTPASRASLNAPKQEIKNDLDNLLND